MISLIVRTKCDDGKDDISYTIDTVNKLRVSFNLYKVSIGAGVSTYLSTEISNGLIEKITKNCESLGRNASYTKTSRISRLPKYLTINFVRFQWKPQERVKAKILKVNSEI